MNEELKPEDARDALRKGCNGSSNKMVSVRRQAVEVALGSGAIGFLAECRKGNPVYVKVDRRKLIDALDRTGSAPAAPAPKK